MTFLRDKLQGLTYALSNFFKSVLGFNFCKVDNFRRKILGYLVFVKLTGDNLTELCRDDARMGVIFARDIDAEYIGISGANVVCFLEVKLNND